VQGSSPFSPVGQRCHPHRWSGLVVHCRMATARAHPGKCAPSQTGQRDRTCCYTPGDRVTGVGTRIALTIITSLTVLLVAVPIYEVYVIIEMKIFITFSICNSNRLVGLTNYAQPLRVVPWSPRKGVRRKCPTHHIMFQRWGR